MGESLNVETKHHSHSVEWLKVGYVCQFHWAPQKRSTAWPETTGCRDTNTEHSKGSSQGWHITIFYVRDMASEGNYTFKIIGASRSTAPDGKHQRCRVPWWRLVLGYLKVDFWRDCPATSERAVFRGRTPCSPTWGCVSHWACIHTQWQRTGFPIGSDLACGNCRTWLAILSRRSQCQWTALWSGWVAVLHSWLGPHLLCHMCPYKQFCPHQAL